MSFAHNMIKACFVVLLVLVSPFETANAQQIGDVGQDPQGNVYTWGYDENGNRAWIPGRVANATTTRTVTAQRYIPTIWIDPDGCEHWVMDDGAEGFMTPHLTRDGLPVCNRSSICGVMQADQFFSTGSSKISPQGQQTLRDFFARRAAKGYGIYGHTDSRGSDEANLRLSINRANAVAQIAQTSGVRIFAVQGYGERNPRVPNNTAANMAQNRRVEITCFN